MAGNEEFAGQKNDLDQIREYLITQQKRVAEAATKDIPGYVTIEQLQKEKDQLLKRIKRLSEQDALKEGLATCDEQVLIQSLKLDIDELEDIIEDHISEIIQCCSLQEGLKVEHRIREQIFKLESRIRLFRLIKALREKYIEIYPIPDVDAIIKVEISLSKVLMNGQTEFINKITKVVTQGCKTLSENKTWISLCNDREVLDVNSEQGLENVQELESESQSFETALKITKEIGKILLEQNRFISSLCCFLDSVKLHSKSLLEEFELINLCLTVWVEVQNLFTDSREKHKILLGLLYSIVNKTKMIIHDISKELESLGNADNQRERKIKLSFWKNQLIKQVF